MLSSGYPCLWVLHHVTNAKSFQASYAPVTSQQSSTASRGREKWQILSCAAWVHRMVLSVPDMHQCQRPFSGRHIVLGLAACHTLILRWHAGSTA